MLFKVIEEHDLLHLIICFSRTMKCLIPTFYLSLIFHYASCCLPETKPEYCNMVQSDPHQMERILDGNRWELQMSDVTEFCNSDSIGDGSNHLCESIQELTPIMSTSLAGNLTEFCNPESQILRRQFRGRQAPLEISIQPNIAIGRQGRTLQHLCPLIGGRRRRSVDERQGRTLGEICKVKNTLQCNIL